MSTNFDGIPFDVLEPMTDWTITANRPKEQIPYSNITITERVGHAPARASWSLLFYTREDYFAFVAKIGETGVLTLPANLQSLKGTQITRGNPAALYDVLDAVSVEEIDNPRMHRGGKVRVSATFERMVDPVTRLAVS